MTKVTEGLRRAEKKPCESVNDTAELDRPTLAEHDARGRIKVSVIMPVYNAEKYLAEAIESVLSQSLKELELICVPCNADDETFRSLRECSRKDGRMKVIGQSTKNVGVARNVGLREAVGEYFFFCESDGICAPSFLQKAVAKADSVRADIVVFDFNCGNADGRCQKRAGVRSKWISGKADTFSYFDCPKRIMNVAGPQLWNKLYRASFVRKNALCCDEIPTMSSVSFSAVSCAMASKVAVMTDALYTHREDAMAGDTEFSSECRLCDVVSVVESVLAKTSALPKHEEIEVAIDYFVVDACITVLFAYGGRACSRPEFQSFYESVRGIFLSERFENLTRADFGDDKRYNSFLAVRRHDYEKYCELRSRRLVVSLTSYPARINAVSSVLETIYGQTHPADELVLYLAACQFPGGEEDLPESLRALAKGKKLTIRWCPVDLKPHKKYFYAFQDYPDDVVVTIDDDLLYDPKLLEDLYDSYLLHPRAISTARTHLMVMSEDGEFLPYSFWPMEVDGLLYEPSMQLFGTNGAGTLFPPHLLNLDILLDEEAINATCLYADDLWLKTVELTSDVPVVLARKYRPLEFVPGTQDVALYKSNVNQNENDRQLQDAVSLMESRFGKGIVRDKFLQPIGVQLVGRKEILEMVDKKRRSERGALNRQIRSLSERYRKLQNASTMTLVRLTARIDVKNVGTEGNSLNVLDVSDSSASVESPAWFRDASGVGRVVKSGAGNLDLCLRCVGNGELQIRLRGQDVKGPDGKRIPVWIDYTSLVVDGELLLSEPVAAWHDKPFVVKRPVKDGQIVSVSLSWHSHDEQALRATTTRSVRRAVTWLPRKIKTLLGRG